MIGLTDITSFISFLGIHSSTDPSLKFNESQKYGNSLPCKVKIQFVKFELFIRKFFMLYQFYMEY